MLGKILRYDEETKMSMVRCGTTNFTFGPDVWNEEEPPKEGDHVFVNQRRNKVLAVYSAADYMPKGEPVKSKWIAGLLGVLLGFLGMGRFYLGYYKIGFLQLLVTVVTLGFGAMWGFIDGVMILMGQVIKDAQNRPLK